jgi:hypothetical protein
MMTLDKAQLVIRAAIAKAQEIGQPMNIAVVDAGTNRPRPICIWPELTKRPLWYT